MWDIGMKRIRKDKSSLINTLLSVFPSLYFTHTCKTNMRKYAQIHTFEASSEVDFDAVIS